MVRCVSGPVSSVQAKIWNPAEPKLEPSSVKKQTHTVWVLVAWGDQTAPVANLAVGLKNWQRMYPKVVQRVQMGRRDVGMHTVKRARTGQRGCVDQLTMIGLLFWFSLGSVLPTVG